MTARQYLKPVIGVGATLALVAAVSMSIKTPRVHAEDDVLTVMRKRSFLNAAPTGTASEWEGRGRTKHSDDRKQYNGTGPVTGWQATR